MTDIIDLIDNAIADSLSPDAMRWSPEATEESEPATVTLHGFWTYDPGQTFSVVDEDGRWREATAEDLGCLRPDDHRTGRGCRDGHGVASGSARDLIFYPLSARRN